MNFRLFIKAFGALGILVSIVAQPASAQSPFPTPTPSPSPSPTPVTPYPVTPSLRSYGSAAAQEVITGVVQNVVQNVRDLLQRRRVAPAIVAVTRFTGEESDFNSRDPFAAKGLSNPFGALAYAKAPAPAAVATSAWLYGANLVGNADRSNTFGTDTRVETVTGAFDVTKIGIFTASDALSFIGTGSQSWSRADAFNPAGPSFITDGSIPSTSGTVSYLNGGFSTDFTALASWTRNTVNSLLFVAPNSSSIAYTGNAQYRFDFPYSVWIEPTAGVTYTEVYSANFGTKLADLTEVHAGGRIGTEMKWMGYTVQPTLSGSVFQVVDSNVSLAPLAALIPATTANVGTFGGRGSGKITVLWTSNFSSYLEVHGSGTASTKTLPIGNPNSINSIGTQAGLRYSWN